MMDSKPETRKNAELETSNSSERERRNLTVRQQWLPASYASPKKSARNRADASLSCTGTLRSHRLRHPLSSFERDAAFVVGEPHVKRLQGRIETARDFGFPSPAEVRVEVTLELEHIAEIIRSGEVQSAVRLR